jgi:hypothetical protein
MIPPVEIEIGGIIRGSTYLVGFGVEEQNHT